MMFILYFIIGLFVGSFLGVVVDRISRNETFAKGRSYCEKCKKELAWKDLIPLFSFLFLKGRCRYCKTPLSPFYPVIELSTGIGFAITAQFFFPINNFQLIVINYQIMLTLLFYLFIVSILIIIFFTDLKYGIIPDKVLIPAIIITFFYKALTTNFQVLNIICSAFGASLFFLFLILITKGKGMGFGDVKFAFLIGLLLGFPNVIASLYLAFLTGSLISIILILWKKKRFQKDTIPFGPFLAFSTFLCLFWGDLIIQEVLRLLNF